MKPTRHRATRRSAFVGAGMVAAMVLLPGTALAGPNLLDNSLSRSTGNPQLGPPDVDDDSAGHETVDPQGPDHASGENVTYVFGHDAEHDVLHLAHFDASANSDGSSSADVTVFGLLGDELVGSHSDSAGNTSEHGNPTEALCESTGGALCLSVLYADTAADQNESGTSALARGGVTALCLGSSTGQADATNDCEDSFASFGFIEGVGTINRNSDAETAAGSSSNAMNLCLLGDAVPDAVADLMSLGEAIGSDEDGFCDGFGFRMLPSSAGAAASANDAAAARDSEYLVIDGPGTEFLNDATSFALPTECDDPSLVCVFLNQGETFLFDSGVANLPGAAAAQEAFHLDLAKGTPLAILGEAYLTEALARYNPGDDGVCDPTGNDPDCAQPADSKSGPAECNDGIDFGSDPGCASTADDSEADNLAATGADTAPLLAGAFALVGFGALTVAGTSRRRPTGRHSV